MKNVKKLLAFASAIVMLASVPLTASAETSFVYDPDTSCVSCNDTFDALGEDGPMFGCVNYIVNKDGRSVTITAIGDCFSGRLVLPHEIDGLPVTAVGDEALLKPDLSALVLPDVKPFADKGGCERLADFDLPDELKAVGKAVLADKRLRDLLRPCGVETFDEAGFDSRRLLENIDIPDSFLPDIKKTLTDIDVKTFLCPGFMKETGDEAFRGCPLECIVLPKSIDKICKDAFASLKDLCLVCREDSIADHIFSLRKKFPDRPPIMGDVDGDEAITSEDALDVLVLSLNGQDIFYVGGDLLWQIDVDNDGEVTTTDSLFVLRHSIGFGDDNNIGKTAE